MVDQPWILWSPWIHHLPPVLLSRSRRNSGLDRWRRHANHGAFWVRKRCHFGPWVTFFLGPLQSLWVGFKPWEYHGYVNVMGYNFVYESVYIYNRLNMIWRGHGWDMEPLKALFLMTWPKAGSFGAGAEWDDHWTGWDFPKGNGHPPIFIGVTLW